MANKVGRSFLKGIYAAANRPMKAYTLSDWTRKSLEWFLAFLCQFHGNVRLLHMPQRPHVRSWTDACSENRMIASIICLPGGEWQYIEWQVPQMVLDVFLSRQDNWIGVLECMAVVLTVSTCKFENIL